MNHDDLIFDIVKILNNQINPGVSQNQVTPAKMTNFLSLILGNSGFLLPYSVKNLKKEDMKQLTDHCKQL